MSSKARGYVRRFAGALFFAALLPLPVIPVGANALSACKAKVSKLDGTLLLSAQGAAGPLLWGTDPTDATRPLGGCRGEAASPKRCQLGDTGTLAARTAPASCIVYLADGSETCAAWVQGCTVGLRLVDESFPADDPRVRQGVSLENEGRVLRFSAVNVQVVDGSGGTDGDTNGLGNLIVGYNEDAESARDRSGSHNLVVGSEHTFSSYGGFVAGLENAVTGPNSSVSGGERNIASYDVSSVSGGRYNRASYLGASVSGGIRNSASGSESSVSGGFENTAGAEFSSVSGGYRNTASGSRASVGGGTSNEASAHASSVSGGTQNRATAEGASVSGGDSNEASGVASSVTGGLRNRSSNVGAAVGGGSDNESAGLASSVSGGLGRSVSGNHDWRAGAGLFEDQ
jgi:hypothetical protein